MKSAIARSKAEAMDSFSADLAIPALSAKVAKAERVTNWRREQLILLTLSTQATPDSFARI
ncbi:MAG TPA: hypothetical protein VMZ27_01525, partial [Candidatus Saccharimonadales bacterium]|nr:hypothetical protein [Candidatus Saccharimonadales bacterium]